jgi:hypothetical protein
MSVPGLLPLAQVLFRANDEQAHPFATTILATTGAGRDALEASIEILEGGYQHGLQTANTRDRRAT